MLKKRKIFKKAIIILMVIIAILGGGISIKYLKTKNLQTKTIGIDNIESVKGSETVTSLNLENNGTINPIYKPKWEKVGDAVLDATNKKLTINVKATANESQTIDSNVKIDYDSNVTSTLVKEDVIVYVDGVEVTSTTNPVVATNLTSASASGEEVTYSIVLSNLEEAYRQTDTKLPYKEWSGNIKIQIKGRSQNLYYTGNDRILYDDYGNQNMMETDENGTNADGSWIEVAIKDTTTINTNTTGKMFADFVKPEYTYKWADTQIGSGETGDKKVRVVFDVVDKYFNSTTITQASVVNSIAISLLDTTPATVIDASKITKAITKKTISADTTDATTGVTYKANGDIYYDIDGDGTKEKIGERYELVIGNLDQGAGFDYSGPMSIALPAGVITDKSGNTNNAKTITIGINEDDGNMDTNEDGTQQIVDVVNPVWKSGTTTITTDPTTGVTTANLELIATDKYFKQAKYTLDELKSMLKVYVAGEDKTSQLQISLTGPTTVENGVKYVFSLTNFEETYAEFLAQRAQYNTNSSTGRLYREFSGQVQVQMPAGTVEDNYGNVNEEYTVSLGVIDTLKPEIVKVSSSTNDTAKTQTIVFDVTDKFLQTSGISTTDTSKIHVLIDGEEAESITKPSTTAEQEANKDKIFKEITNIETLTATINGTSKTIGYRYTLVLSDFEAPRTSINYSREFTDWSGLVKIKIDANTAVDSNGTGNAETILDASHTDTGATTDDHVDFVKPDVTYKYAESSQSQVTQGDINYQTKTFTMVFDVTDKYFANSTLTIEDLQILIDGEEPEWRTTGTTGVTKTLTSADIKNTFSKTVSGTTSTAEYVIGKRYTLTLSNLEQLQIVDGNYYLDYSGVVTVAIPAGKVTDTEGNSNNSTTITSGVNLPGGVAGESEIVDVVDPFIQRISSSAYAFNPDDKTTSIATLTLRATDKYLSDTTITTSDIQVLVNGTVTTSGITTTISDPTYKKMDVLGNYVTTTNQAEAIGVEYTVTVKGWAQNANQVKVRIATGAVTDTSGNGNKVTDLIVYNCLELTSEETARTSGFLGETSIQRQNIEKVVFVNSTSASTASGVKKVWDVSAQGDNSILAWYSESSAPYTVYIGSNWEIFGNQDSTYLFCNIAYSGSCTATTVIENIELLNTRSIKIMYRMFQNCGYASMTILDLGNNFYTENVTSMFAMFENTGYKSMTKLDLGDNFNTSRVISIHYMFQRCGYTAMTNLDLGGKFDTSKVNNMSYMFAYTGYTAMTSLKLGDKFDTSKVTNMSNMFYACGYEKLTEINLGDLFDTSDVTNMSNMFREFGKKSLMQLDLGNKFDTSNVTNMYCMFYECGNIAMASLDLGDKFNTGNVTDMYCMFAFCGNSALTSLDLGDKFDTSNVTNMSRMFYNCGTTLMTTLDLGPAFTKIAETNTDMFTYCGKSGAITIYAPESIYKNKNAFKLRSSDTSTTISYTRGTINPIYRPQWEKVSSAIDTTNKKLTVTVKGSAYNSQTIDSNVTINYASNVTSTLEAGDITVFVNGVEVTSTTNPTVAIGTGTTSTNATSGKTDITHVITLSNLEEASRRANIPYKELSGNIKIKIGGRGEATSTYTANVLKDQYGNQNMMETDQTGTWLDVTYEDSSVTQNTNGTMFTDFIKPEYTYKWDNTEIGSGKTGDKKVRVVFDVTDKYFNNTTIAQETNVNNIAISLVDTTPATTIDPSKITKAITKKTASEDTTDATTGVTYKANGDIYFDIDGDGVQEKIGERYELVIGNLDQGAGFDYSGPMSIALPAGVITDNSGNTNNAKTITIGINEDDGNMDTNEDGSQEIVDVVDPVWELVESSRDTGINKIRAVDKYFKECTITTDKIHVYVNGTLDGDLNGNGVLDEGETPLIGKTLSAPTYIKLDSSGNYVATENQDEAVGVEYTFTLSNITIDNAGYTTFTPSNMEDGLVEGEYKYRAENGGEVKIKIEAGTVEDDSGNQNLEKIFDMGMMDATSPEVYDIQKIQNAEADTLTFIFNVTDRNYYSEDLVDLSEISVWVDDNQVTDITKSSLTYIPIKTDINADGTPDIVGHQYTLVLSDISETHAEFIANGRDYKEWSGTIEIRIAESASRDINGNTLNPETTAINDFVDYIKPETRYQYAESSQNQNPQGDINYQNKTFTMVFDIIDKYYKESTLETELENATTDTEKQGVIEKYLTILIDGEEPDWTKVGKSLTVSDVKSTFNKTTDSGIVNGEYVIGKRFTLVLSNLEQLQIKAGDYYLDYSGVITVAINPNVVKDSQGNGNNAKTITSGIDVKGNVNLEDDSNSEIVDVVDPFIERLSSSAYAFNPDDKTTSIATVTLRATDKYLSDTTITTSDIQVVVNGTVVTEGITTTIGSPTYKKLDGDGNFVTTTDQSEAIGVEYTITAKGWAQDANQVKIRIATGAVTDISGNGNKETDLIAYNCLELTSSETGGTSGFLGETSIQRQNIEKVVFVNSTEASTAEGVKKVWDASAQGDTSILAWYSEASAPYTVYIGSNWEIFGNQNSTNLFRYIGYSSTCTATQTIQDINLLNVKSITNMQSMFESCGCTAMTSLDLGDKFDTSNVIFMDSMFRGCGRIAMTSLNLGDKFDTSNVANMGAMFDGCGELAMTNLDLGDKFDTSNVTYMCVMFQMCGEESMISLDLGDKFDTSNVTDMNSMFKNCGRYAMTSLDLGDKFDTSKVTDMGEMFAACGGEAMTSLDLGNKFDTSNVTNMIEMFKICGEYAMTSLDLGDKFDTSNVTNMDSMFRKCGRNAMTTLDLSPAFTKIAETNTDIFTDCGKSGATIYAPESIYKNKNAFKLSSSDTTTTIEYTRGTINLIYRPQWEKVGATMNKTSKTLTVTLKGSAYHSQTIDSNVTINYASDVTSNLVVSNIQVFVNGVDVTSTTRPRKVLNSATTGTNETTGKTEVTHTFVLSNLEEASRQADLPYTEWSGNISIKVLGRGEDTSTYTANTLVDQYGNQSMMETDEEDGTWVDIIFEDEEKDRNSAIDGTVTEITNETPVYMFADFIKPEFTYKYAGTSRDTEPSDNPEINYDTKTLTVIFDVTDKYYDVDNSTLLLTDFYRPGIDTSTDGKVIFKVDGEDVDVNKEGNSLTEDALIDGTGKRYGTRYTLVVKNLEQSENDGFTYSGTATIAVPKDKFYDLSGNSNNAKTITIGINQPEGDGSSEIVDVVDPIIYYHSSSIDLDAETVTLTVRADDKYLSSEQLVELQNNVIVKVVKPNGQIVTSTAESATLTKTDGTTEATTPISRTITRTQSGTQYMLFQIVLSNFVSQDGTTGVWTRNEGVTSVIIPANMVKDAKGNGNKETEILVGNESDSTAFKDSIVDFTDPTWNYVTSSINRVYDASGRRLQNGELTADSQVANGTVTLEVKGTDIYFDDKYYNDSAYQLNLSNVKVYVNGVEDTHITKAFAQNDDGSIKKEYVTETAENGDILKGVKYTIILGNFRTNEGIVNIEILENEIRDISTNGNRTTPINVGNPTWVETDVEEDDVDVNNPKYTAFRNSYVDFIKPVIQYKYEENVNPLLNRDDETVQITFTAVDTNFLESNIGLEDIKVFIDDMQVYGNGTQDGVGINASISNSDITDGSANGIKYTLTLSALELNTFIEPDVFERHSGVIKLIIAKDQVRDTSGNPNDETTIIIDNDNGDSEANGVIVDFINPNIFLQDKYVNWEDRYALITLRVTDRFYDVNTALEAGDITLYEQNSAGEYIQITDFAGKISISERREVTQYGNLVGYDYIIRLTDFDEEFRMKLVIPAGVVGDTSGNTNDAYTLETNTAIDVDIDNKKPRWVYQYLDANTENFEENGTISFNVKGVDKFLDIARSGLEVSDLKIIKDGQLFLDGSDEDDATKITVNYLGTNTEEEADLEKYKAYKIDVEGLTEVGTYSLVFAKETLVDEFNNKSAAKTITFSKSAIFGNTANFVNVTYHVSPDNESVHNSYIHELMSVNTTGTNFENTTYRPSTLGELHNDGENPLFAEPIYDVIVNGYDITYNYAPKSFAGWAEADNNGNIIYYTDSTLEEVSDGTTEYYKLFGLYDEIPDTITNLKAVWQEATVIFVSSTGSNSNSGTKEEAPVKDLQTAFTKLSASGTAENNIIVIMDEITWDSTSTISKNATITSLYAGVDYRKDNSAELKISSNMNTSKDLIFDNIELYSLSTTVSDGSDYLANGTYSNMLIANYANITIGRRVTTPTDKYTFGAIIGGNYKDETSSGNLGTHTIRVEAGKYNNIIGGNALSEATSDTTRNLKYASHQVVIGNMKDSAVSRNDKLTITGYVAIAENDERCFPAGSTGTSNAYNKVYSDVTIYSGVLTGDNVFETGNIVIYSKSINGEADGISQTQMYGGEIHGNIYAGTRVATTYKTSIVNVMKFYGGNVTGNIFGQGLNKAYTGSSEITISGIFNITGDIFGGLNITNSATINGEGDSNITVNSSSVVIDGNIYGAGNGGTGDGDITGATNVTLKAGTVGNIYGSGKNYGNTGDTIITMQNGTVIGNIVGGAYNSQCGLNASITVVGGTVRGNIYGGNENTTQAYLDSDTTSQNVTIVIGNIDSEIAPTVNGIIYGGGKFDNIENVEIQLIKCANITSVYGGSDTNGQVITSKVYLKGMTVNEIYGGSQSAGSVVVSNIYSQFGTAGSIYGGGYGTDVVEASILLEGTQVEVEDEDTGEVQTVEQKSTVTSIFGGSNGGTTSSGTVTVADITLKSGNLTNVFGGGNSAPVGTANVTLDGITVDTIYGGSKDAGLTTNANIVLNSGTVTNVFGGGLGAGTTTSNVTHTQGVTVTNIYGGSNGGNTTTSNIEIANSTVTNVYGGNLSSGTTRYANITIHGSSVITGELYGGGNEAGIGASGENGTTTINIAGGTINNDINGGSKQSIVYGTTNINIGKDAISDNSELVASNIEIKGTIYGAGDSANTSNYDYVSVEGNTKITIDNSEESPITYSGSIFGSGKGATYSTSGTSTDKSTIHIKDLGTANESYALDSIERTGTLFIGNSFIELFGRQDVNNANRRTSYTLNRVTNTLTIYNNTTLYTRRGFNMVGGFNSYSTVNSSGTGVRATASALSGGASTDTDNRLYTFEGVNLVFAKQESDLYADITQDIWGDVNGMAFFGMYRINRTTGNKEYDIYDPNYDGEEVQDIFDNGTYVEARHKTSHNTQRDGFYTNIVEEGETTATAQYIGVIDYGKYYDWIIGAKTIDYATGIIASTYQKESMAELVLDREYVPGTTYKIDTISLNALNTNIELINPLEVPTISTNANSTFGLTMGTTNSGWFTSDVINIYTADGGSHSGEETLEFESDHSANAGTIKFRLYNSINITEKKDLGYINITLIAKTPAGEDGTPANVFKIAIALNIQTIIEDQVLQYEPRFTDYIETELDYTSDSKIDLSYLLYRDVNSSPYDSGDYRVISTTEKLPAGTRITVKDYGQGDDVNKVYYYHVTGSETEIDGTRYLYKLSNFIEMGSKDYNYVDNTDYYNSTNGYVLEKYDVSIDFIDSNINTNKLAQETYFELRKSDGTVKYDNGDTEIKYNLYSDKNTVFTESISNENRAYSVVDELEVPFTLSLSMAEQDGVMDTKYYNQIAGISIQIVDNNGTRIKLPELQNFKIVNNTTNEIYRANSSTVMRIPIMESFATMTYDYTLSVGQSNVPPGVYTVLIQYYTADDGLYYGTEPVAEKRFMITFVSKLLGAIGAEATDDSRIVNKSTGKNLEGNDGIDVTLTVGQPTSYTNIRVELYKRDTTYTVTDGTAVYNGISYTAVDITDYLEGEWKVPSDYGLTAENENEYMVLPKVDYGEEDPPENLTIEFEKTIKNAISTGEYKLLFKAYNDDILVQTVKKTFIVAP